MNSVLVYFFQSQTHGLLISEFRKIYASLLYTLCNCFYQLKLFPNKKKKKWGMVVFHLNSRILMICGLSVLEINIIIMKSNLLHHILWLYISQRNFFSYCCRNYSWLSSKSETKWSAWGQLQFNIIILLKIIRNRNRNNNKQFLQLTLTDITLRYLIWGIFSDFDYSVKYSVLTAGSEKTKRTRQVTIVFLFQRANVCSSDDHQMTIIWWLSFIR